MSKEEGLLKRWLERFLIINLFVVISGGLLFLLGVISSLYGFEYPYKVFQRLWFPLFIPAISLFFTSVLIEALWNKLNKAS